MGAALPLHQGTAPAELDALGLRRAVRGDRRAIRTLVQIYERRVRALVRRMLVGADPQTVDDLAQECFIRVFGALPRFEVGKAARLSTWILTIATRLCIDELRRRRPERTALGVDRGVHAGANDSADQGLRRERLRVAMRRAIAQLNPEQRAVLVLHLFHGHSYAEIGEMLEVELGTVKSRMGRARAFLRAQLKEVHDDV